MVVDIRHWLDEAGQPAGPVRRQALRIARLIEYGGPLQARQFRQTLVECSRRVQRKPCEGLLWVEKQQDGRIVAFCRMCEKEEIYISGWEETEWADGPMEPFSVDDLPTEH
jgi:hypothetical protein